MRRASNQECGCSAWECFWYGLMGAVVFFLFLVAVTNIHSWWEDQVIFSCQQDDIIETPDGHQYLVQDSEFECKRSQVTDYWLGNDQVGVKYLYQAGEFSDHEAISTLYYRKHLPTGTKRVMHLNKVDDSEVDKAREWNQ